jgi:hypothetical protein
MIKANDILTARSICDHNCIWTARVIKRTAATATVEIDGNIKRCKIHNHEGKEFIFALGQYSMAPVFK